MRHNQAICLHTLITPIQKYSKYKEIPSRRMLSTNLLGSAPGSALEHCIGPHARKHKNNLILHTSLQTSGVIDLLYPFLLPRILKISSMHVVFLHII